ncbi:MAG: ATP-binding protein [Rikenellaceae bacterium]
MKLGGMFTREQGEIGKDEVAKNPFLVAGYYTPEYFCGRDAESATIVDALRNGRDVTLLAPRRMGKTGLIRDIFYKLQRDKADVVTIYIDIYSTQNLNDLVALLAASILGQLDSTAQAIMSRVTQFIKSCRPIFTIDSKSGMPIVSLDVEPHCEQATLKEIFEYLGSSEKRCYIAIDEFQQIGDYPDKGVEALLRSYIQFLPNVNFIFSGSKQHVMQDMFLSSKRPFYQSTQLVAIDKIECDEYFAFAEKFFKRGGVKLNRECFDDIYGRFDGHTWYMQTVLNHLYGRGRDVLLEEIEDAINSIVEGLSYFYGSLMAAYSSNNVALLKAIAREGEVKALTSSKFIAKHRLGAASSIKTSLVKLIDRELIYKSESGYRVYDRFMAIWFRNQRF